MPIWEWPKIQKFWAHVQKFAIENVSNFALNDQMWALFGYLDPDKYKCDPGVKKLFHFVLAPGNKAILETWLQNHAPLLKLFSEKILSSKNGLDRGNTT